LIGLLPHVRLIDADYIDVEEKSQQVGKSANPRLTCMRYLR
jgi:hypothetical protein